MDVLGTRCPRCHQGVRPADFYCSQCGAHLKPLPPDVSFAGLFKLFSGTIILPPLGILWGWRYLRGDTKAQLIGMTIIAITVIELSIITMATVQLVNGINAQVNSQLQNIQMY